MPREHCPGSLLRVHQETGYMHGNGQAFPWDPSQSTPEYHVRIDTRLSPSVLIFCQREGRAWERGNEATMLTVLYPIWHFRSKNGCGGFPCYGNEATMLTVLYPIWHFRPKNSYAKIQTTEYSIWLVMATNWWKTQIQRMYRDASCGSLDSPFVQSGQQR